jgi:hypothetical protein
MDGTILRNQRSPVVYSQGTSTGKCKYRYIVHNQALSIIRVRSISNISLVNEAEKLWIICISVAGPAPKSQGNVSFWYCRNQLDVLLVSVSVLASQAIIRQSELHCALKNSKIQTRFLFYLVRLHQL